METIEEQSFAKEAKLSVSDVQTWLLTEATPTDLNVLKEMIILKQRMQVRVQFSVGSRVMFDAKTRGMVHGKITKMNAKTVKVLADSGMIWTVGPNLLQTEVK